MMIYCLERLKADPTIFEVVKFD